MSIVDLGISSSLVVRKKANAAKITDINDALVIMSKSSVDEYLQILLYIPNKIKEHIVEKNTIKELIIGAVGKTSNLSQYAPKNAITLNIPSMLQIKNNLIIGCIIILSYYFLVFYLNNIKDIL